MLAMLHRQKQKRRDEGCAPRSIQFRHSLGKVLRNSPRLSTWLPFVFRWNTTMDLSHSSSDELCPAGHDNDWLSPREQISRLNEEVITIYYSCGLIVWLDLFAFFPICFPTTCPFFLFSYQDVDVTLRNTNSTMRICSGTACFTERLWVQCLEGCTLCMSLKRNSRKRRTQYAYIASEMS